MLELWIPIKGYEGWYEVSNLGNVRSVDRRVDFADGRHANYIGQPIKQTKHYHGYWVVNLFKNKKQDSRYVHRLMAEAFILNPENKPNVNHKDRDKTNNQLSNLEWCTQAENLQHAKSTEPFTKAENQNPQNDYSEEIETKIMNMHPKNPGTIHQYDKLGTYIDSYDSCRQAARVIGGSDSAISAVVSGKRKSHKGFIWKRG